MPRHVSDRIHGSTPIHHVCDSNLHFFFLTLTAFALQRISRAAC